MEKQSLKACIDSLRSSRSLSECVTMIVNAEFDEHFGNSNEWFAEVISYLKNASSHEGTSQLLLTLCHSCQVTFMSERVDIEPDLKKRITELGEKVAEGQMLIKQQPQFAPVVYAAEAAFYLYSASLNIRFSRKNRQPSSGRSAFDGTFALLALCYDLSVRASAHFIELSALPSTNESKILAQAERINAVNSAVAGAMLVERLHSLQPSRSGGGVETWSSKFPNLLTDSQASLRRTLDVKENSAIMTSLCYSSSSAMLSSSMPSLPELLPMFERLLISTFDLQALVWCVVHLRRCFPITSVGVSHQYTDALVVESLATGESLRRCNHLPSSLAGDFSSPSADALCQLDVIAFVLMAAARVELSLSPLDESISDSILPPFMANTLSSSELTGESFWLTSSQIQWWRAVICSTDRHHQQTHQSLQDPFTKFRLIQDGLFLLRLSGIDAKLLPLAIKVAEAFQAFVLDSYFNTIHQESGSESQKISSLPVDIRRFHVYCTKYWDNLLQFVHASRSTPHHHHHGQRVSMGSSAVPPSRQQRFFEPFPMSSGVNTSLDSLSSAVIPPDLRNRITNLASFYLGFDAHLNGNHEASVKMLKTCSNEFTLANFIEGNAFEAMAVEAYEKSTRTTTSSSSWVVRQLYESALTAYEKAVNYSQNNIQQVQRALVVEAASRSVARIKKQLFGAHAKPQASKTSDEPGRLAIAPVNGGCESSISAESPLPSASVQQQQALALIQQQQEQSISVLNNTVGQLVPAIRDLSSAARDLADVARQLRDLERQLRESVVRMECSIQQQQRPSSSIATATPPVSTASTAGGITAEQLLPLLVDLIRERNVQPSQVPYNYASPSPQNIQGQSSLLMRQLGIPAITSSLNIGDQLAPAGLGFGIPGGKPEPYDFPVTNVTQFPSTCAMATAVPPFQQQLLPPASSAFSPLVPPAQPASTHFPQRMPTMPLATAAPPSSTTAAPPPSTVNNPTPPVAKDKKTASDSSKQQPKPLADLFRPAPGTWSCSTCLVRNSETAERCVACEQPKPSDGAASQKVPVPTTNASKATSVAKPAEPKLFPQISFPAPAATNQKQQQPQPAFGVSLFPKASGEVGSIVFGPGSPSTPLFGVKPAGNALSVAVTSTTATPTQTTTATSTTPVVKAKPDTATAMPFGTSANKPQADTATAGLDNVGGEDESGESPEAFVPTAEYNPVAQLPQNYEIVTGEENEERLFSDKAKLYRWADSTNEWKERGVGEMKVLRNKISGRSRILMRREQVLKPCANHYITSEFALRPFAAVGDRGFCWLAADFAEVESGDHPQIMQLAIRFRNVESAQEFKKVVESCRNSTPSTSDNADGQSMAKPNSGKQPSSQPHKQQVPQQQHQPAKPVAAVNEPKQAISFPATTLPSVTPASLISGGSAVGTVANAAPGQPSGLPVPIFGSSFVKRSDVQTSTIPSSGLFSFAALAAANASDSTATTSTASSSPFVGPPEPLFKSVPAKTATAPQSKAVTPATTAAVHEAVEGGEEAVEGGEQPESFVPTSEYKPVVQLPSDYKHISGEEGFERVFSERCKLYRWDNTTNEWKERGIGDIRLMKATDGSCKYRVVMRREHIHTVCANHYLTISPSMKLGRLPSAADRAVTWFTPTDYSDGEAKLETLCARFKAPAVADKFSSTFEAALKELSEKYGNEKSPSKPAVQDSKPPQAVPPTEPPSITVTITPQSVAGSNQNMSTPSFSFRADSSNSPSMTTATPNSSVSTLFGASLFSSAPKPQAVGSEANAGSSSFSGFRFGALGAPTTTAPSTVNQPIFGGNSTAGFGTSGGAGSFSFSGVFPAAATPTSDAQKSGESSGTTKTTLKGRDVGSVVDDDCVLVGTMHSNPDEVARARQYQLPDDFYLYRLRKPCSGCPGCEQGDNDFSDHNNENMSISAVNKLNSGNSSSSNSINNNKSAPNVQSIKNQPAAAANSVNSNLAKSQIPSPSFSSR